MPGLFSTGEQQPFPDQGAAVTGGLVSPDGGGVTRKLNDATGTGPLVTGPLFQVVPFSTPTRQLPELQSMQTGQLLPLNSSTTSMRTTVVIKGAGKRSQAKTGAQPAKRRRWPVQLAVLGLVAVVVLGTLLAVLPEGTDANGHGHGIFQPLFNMFQNNDGNYTNNASLQLIAQRAATATAITVNHSGYDPGPTTQMPVTGSSSGDYFPYGQCTWWADYRYHQMAGYFIPWGGNAGTWAAGAAASHWVVSAKPRVPSIIVLQSRVQGAGWVGHVAVVERINSDGSVLTSNFNWYADGGGFAIKSYWTFTPGPGVSFVWHP